MPSKKKTITFSETKKEISKSISKNEQLPDELKEKLTDTIYSKVEEILERLPIKPKAIIWSGGFPRGEATYVQGKLINDLDLFVIGSFNPFLLKLKELEEWKDLNGDEVKVSISVGTVKHVKNHKTITNFELTTGKVIYGDRSLKEKIKADSDNLSNFEGVRMLFTRLSALQDLNRNELALNYLAAKTYIACADAYFLLSDNYHPSYKERESKLDSVEMPDKLKQKAKKAYQLKLSKMEQVDFSVGSAKKTLLGTIENYLASYIQEGNNTVEKLKALERKVPPSVLLNLYFYLQLRKEFSPKFFSILFCFNIVSLYLALWYYEHGQKKKVEEILSRFVKEKSSDNLLKILHAAPNPSTVELF